MGMIVLLLASFFIAPIPLDQSPYQDFVMVRGSVVDSARHRAIAGATVYADSDADVQVTTSDDKGFFYFLTLLPGNYRFFASKVGYFNACTCYAIGCTLSRQDPQELDAGFDYLASVYLTSRISMCVHY